MTDEGWVEIPLDGIAFIKLIEGDTILLDSLGGSQHPRCPECKSEVLWTSDRLRAQACLCSVKWAFKQGGKVLMLYGGVEAIDKIKTLLGS